MHERVLPFLAHVESWPTVGTPAWCALADDDDRKLAALLDAAQHHALRLELNQEAHAQAAHDVSAAADWRAIAQEINERNQFHAQYPWMKRVAS